MSEKAKIIQEKEVFRAICPKAFLEIIEDTLISYPAYTKVVRMYCALGFEELSQDFSISKWKELYERIPQMSKIADGFDIEEYFISKGDNFNEIAYIKMFLSNIKNASLLDLFQKN